MARAPLILVLAAGARAGPAAAAQAARGGQFSVACHYDHMLPDDPIVFPGKSGMSHSHDFAGAHSTGAASTNASLLDSATTCSRPVDHSAYWVPTVYQDGLPVHAREYRAYYRATWPMRCTAAARRRTRSSCRS